MERVRSIEGTVTLDDGTESHFSIAELGWQQWGATVERLGQTVEVMEALVSGLAEGEVRWEED